jgi:hypothetical protein
MTPYPSHPITLPIQHHHHPSASPSNERLHVYAPSCKGGLDFFFDHTLLPRGSVEQAFDELVPRNPKSAPRTFSRYPPKQKTLLQTN